MTITYFHEVDLFAKLLKLTPYQSEKDTGYKNVDISLKLPQCKIPIAFSNFMKKADKKQQMFFFFSFINDYNVI